MCAYVKATSGRQHFKPITVSSSPWYVLWSHQLPCNLPEMMNDIFHDLIMEGVVCVYLDDILIYTKFLEEHCQAKHLMLDCLCQNKLFLKHEKCEFEK